eukprot:334857-Chlamydomonas_euryale.AAC.4
MGVHVGDGHLKILGSTSGCAALTGVDTTAVHPAHATCMPTTALTGTRNRPAGRGMVPCGETWLHLHSCMQCTQNTVTHNADSALELPPARQACVVVRTACEVYLELLNLVLRQAARLVIQLAVKKALLGAEVAPGAARAGGVRGVGAEKAWKPGRGHMVTHVPACRRHTHMQAQMNDVRPPIRPLTPTCSPSSWPPCLAQSYGPRRLASADTEQRLLAKGLPAACETPPGSGGGAFSGGEGLRGLPGEAEVFQARGPVQSAGVLIGVAEPAPASHGVPERMLSVAAQCGSLRQQNRRSEAGRSRGCSTARRPRSNAPGGAPTQPPSVSS